MGEIEVLVVGAGPVGLFLTYLLGRAGIRCVLIERRTAPDSHSNAIGIMPPSLHRFAACGLANEIVAAGCCVRTALVNDEVATLGKVDFSSLPPPFSFILTLPQNKLMAILRERLAALDTIQYREGLELTDLQQSADSAQARVRKLEGKEDSQISACFVVGCDGHESTVRRIMGVSVPRHDYPYGFVMGDFEDQTDWGSTARIFFTPRGSVESFPLPGAQRRWIALCESGSDRRDPAYLIERTEAIAGISLATSGLVWSSSFRPSRMLCERFAQGRWILCGDAAHVMSPIGGQGMNTGLADAWHLAGLLRESLRNEGNHASLLTSYDKCRKNASRSAMNRAASGMWLGTRVGQWPSRLRSLFARHILFRWPCRNHLAPHFAMLTVPGFDEIDTKPFQESDGWAGSTT